MPNQILLWKNRKIETSQPLPSITPFLKDAKKRPAILVIPGGGYGCVCESTEGTPIALRFNRLGFHAFVLHYRVAPHAYPAPLQDAVRAIRIIRGRADEWHVIPDRIASCGFSAGGHLAGALGILSKDVDASDQDRYDEVRGTPDAMILCYPVISFEPWSHSGSGKNFAGELTRENIERFSLDRHITKETPPAFLWHTVKDQMVSFRNSVQFAQAMAAADRPCELHLYPFGAHGMLQGIGTDDVSSWPALAKNFLATHWSLREHPERMERYTNAWQGKMQSDVR